MSNYTGRPLRGEPGHRRGVLLRTGPAPEVPGMGPALSSVSCLFLLFLSLLVGVC